MKILPVIHNNSLNLLCAKKYLASTINSKSDDGSMRPKSAYTYRPASFKGLDTIAFIGDLKNLDNLHCPLCGTKMFSKKESAAAMEEAKTVKTPEDLCKYLEKYNEHINPEFKSILKDAKLKFYKNTFPDIDSFLESLRKDYYKKTNHTIEKTFETIDNFINDESLNAHDKDLLLKCRKDFFEAAQNKSHKFILKRLTDILRETAAFLQSEEKNHIYTQILKPLRMSAKAEFLFDSRELNNNDNRQMAFLRNMFYYSNSDIHKVNNKMEAQNDSILNMMLSCENCAIEKNNIFRLNDHASRLYFYNHISELSQHALNGRIESNKAYPLKLIALVRELSFNKINPDYNAEPIKKLSETTGVINNKDCDFELVSYKDMPCITCGQTTITHEQKCDIYEKIKNTTTPYELAEIINENIDLVKRKYLEVADEISFEIAKKPSIKDDELLQNLRKYKKQKNEQLLSGFINYGHAAIKKYNLHKKDKERMIAYLKAVKELKDDLKEDSPFDYETYYKALKDTVGKMDTPHEKEMFKELKLPARTAFLSHLLLFPKKETTEKVGTALKVMAQDLFKNSVATTANLNKMADPHDKAYRRNKPSDKVVMCRSCQNELNGKPMSLWADAYPEIKENMSKNLRKADEIIRKNNIKGYDLYAYEVVQNIRRLSEGQIDISLNSI